VNAAGLLQSQSCPHVPKQYIIIKRFRQELNGASPQSLHSHVGVSVRRDEDYWDSVALGI
jgi:hypothetical protein